MVDVRRIVILGGLGYIGSALCDLYRIVPPNYEVILVDKQFVGPCIAQLPSHFKFAWADIADTLLMKRIMDGADEVYLLASEVEAEKSPGKEGVMWETNYEASRRLIEVCPPGCRLVFASTGNVFGGASQDVDWKEEDAPLPKFPYAESKVALENWLRHEYRQPNWSIVRFGTNYGYAPCTRFNLVTNSFARTAMLGKTIVVHGSGQNRRPTVCVRDAAQAIKFVAEHPDAERNIFHVASENIKIADLAHRVNAAMGVVSRVIHTDDDPAFEGYGLDSSKIKDWGFDFTWGIEAAMSRMKREFGDLFWRPDD